MGFYSLWQGKGEEKTLSFLPKEKGGNCLHFRLIIARKKGAWETRLFQKGGREEKFHLLVGFAFSAAIWKLSVLVVRGGEKEGRMGHLPSFLPSAPE